MWKQTFQLFFAKAHDQHRSDAVTAVWNCDKKIVDHFKRRVANAYEDLSEVSHPLMSDRHVFDEFVTSVQAYLESSVGVGRVISTSSVGFMRDIQQMNGSLLVCWKNV
ncbi:hypothetical protein ACH5RR_026578 [Cinchona calisaya]|uniref:Uncharacterized protein n=1 Tax=Cinchona calisaya TaxID=153742 RepID=A0ABD2Z2Z1_9GENT